MQQLQTTTETNTDTDTDTTVQGEALAKFRDLLLHFSEAMFVTTAPNGHAHARPMHIAGRHLEIPDDLWFVTSLDSAKIEELRAQPEVVLTMADGKRYLSINGWARVVVKQDMIEELWQDSWRLWFPDGPLSPDILLIQVRPFQAEYWDQAFPRSARIAFETVKARVLEQALELPEGPDYHAKLRLSN